MRTKTETGVLREKEKELVISKSLAEKLKTSLHDKESKIVDLESKMQTVTISQKSLEREKDHLTKSLNAEENRVTKMTEELGELRSIKTLYSSLQEQIKAQEKRFEDQLSSKDRDLKRELDAQAQISKEELMRVELLHVEREDKLKYEHQVKVKEMRH